MAWIRLSDDYNDHPKFDNLSDGAFRLWHQAMGFCRKFHTDGLIPIASVRKFKAYTAKRLEELTRPWRGGEHPLWDVTPAGVQVHDYLDWNLSKEEEEEERRSAADRVRRFRAKRKARDGLGNGVRSPERNGEQGGERNGGVPGTGRERNGVLGSLEESEKPFCQPTARSKRPVFVGERLTVFEWQLDDCMKTLGIYANGFDLHAWFDALDNHCRATGTIPPKRDSGAWLQAELVAEAQRRGIPIHFGTGSAMGKQTSRLMQAIANIAAEEAKRDPH